MSNRQCVLLALQKHGQSTYDELEQTTGIPRDKLRIAINAKKAGQVDFGLLAGGQPTYAITITGSIWLKSNGVELPKKSRRRRLLLRNKQPKAEQPLPIPVHPRIIELEVAGRLATGCPVGHSESPDELQKFIGFQDQELVEANRKLNEAQPRILALELAVEEGRKQIEQLENKPAKKTPETRYSPITGYVVARPKKPLRRFTALASAQTIALSAVRAGGQAEVFALLPAGKAVRGAEWKDPGHEFTQWAERAQVR